MEVRDELVEDELLSIRLKDTDASLSASSGYASMRDVQGLEVTGLTGGSGTTS